METCQETSREEPEEAAVLCLLLWHRRSVSLLPGGVTQPVILKSTACLLPKSWEKG